MKMDNSKYDADGQLKDGLFKEYFKKGAVASEGLFKNDEKSGEWKYYLLSLVILHS